ncbi:hypothetical protein ACFL1E_03895 [Candidatus Omnitrophota bacterium]
MRIFVLILILFSLLLAVFFLSNTWETEQRMVDRYGVEYLETKQRINWDNFFNYFKDLPRNIKRNLRQW